MMSTGRGLFRHQIVNSHNKAQMHKRFSNHSCAFCAFLWLNFFVYLVGHLHWERHAAETVDALQPILIKLRIDNSMTT